ncbi:g-protein beta wd-40 repeats containing [Colletotrichum karsti]|uniref:G-protein beta wd-40 repeats containing n=1 Tax=Colletotrichum karsti TaxID=1095194 RepID=A0A9P6HXF7_9PEZI|nr:g-protein beta wd-40 repeats containing [Colletotrichum karsti]KAF9871822.1 g-protein beta wd-40 repeats containing [Colletotrichum karsti]
MSDPAKYTIGWVCAVVAEYVAAQTFLDEKHDHAERVSQHDNNEYTLGRMGAHNVVIAVLPLGEYGISSAASVARDMVHSFPNIRVGLMVGIAGGAPTAEKDIRLGDVVVSSPSGGHGGVLQYDFGKAIQGREFLMTGFLDQPPSVLRTAVAGLQADFEQTDDGLNEMVEMALINRPRKMVKKYGRPPLEMDKLFRSDIVSGDDGPILNPTEDMFIARPPRTDDDDDPAVHFGTIASANRLMKDAEVRDKLATEHGVLCFEMEAAGLMNHFPCLVIRGICDYSDSHKNKDWQGYAAMTAAAYAKALICRIQTTKLEAERKVREEIASVRQELEDHVDDTLLSKLTVAEGANFRDYHDEHEPRCHPETRIALLQEIQAWARSSHDRRIYWLHGPAGTGKSTISRTVVSSLFKDNLLGATFFFKRASHVPELLQFIVKAIKATDDISSKSIAEQFLKLVLGPLSEARSVSNKRFVIVIDALDECAIEDDVSLLVSRLSELVKSEISNVRIFITSRPDIASQYAFHGIHGYYQEILLQDVTRNMITHDITVFLQDELSRIRSRWNTRTPLEQLDADWPGSERIEELARRAVPLFIFAATACRFIQDYDFGSPEKQLARFIDAARDCGINDKLGPTYMPVLRQFQANRTKSEKRQLMAMFQRVVAIKCKASSIVYGLYLRACETLILRFNSFIFLSATFF